MDSKQDNIIDSDLCFNTLSEAKRKCKEMNETLNYGTNNDMFIIAEVVAMIDTEHYYDENGFRI